MRSVTHQGAVGMMRIIDKWEMPQKPMKAMKSVPKSAADLNGRARRQRRISTGNNIYDRPIVRLDKHHSPARMKSAVVSKVYQLWLLIRKWTSPCADSESMCISAPRTMQPFYPSLEQ